MAYKIGIYDLCGRRNYLKSQDSGFSVVSIDEATVMCHMLPTFMLLYKQGVTADQLFALALL